MDQSERGVNSLLDAPTTAEECEEVDYWIRARAAYAYLHQYSPRVIKSGIIESFDDGIRYVRDLIGEAAMLPEVDGIATVPHHISTESVWTGYRPQLRTAWFIGASMLAINIVARNAQEDPIGFHVAAKEHDFNDSWVEAMIGGDLSKRYKLIEKAEIVALAAEWDRVTRFGPQGKRERSLFEAIGSVPLDGVAEEATDKDFGLDA